MSDDYRTAALADARQGDLLAVASLLIGGVEVDCPDGVVIISQSCDITNSSERPNLTVARAVKLSADKARPALKGRRPRWVALTDNENGLFADLEFISTLPKSSVVDVMRTDGIARGDWDQQRKFAVRVGRRFSRIAMPDEVVYWFDELSSKSSHAANNANSPLGRALDVVSEFRIHSKFWTPPGLDLTVYVILETGELPIVDFSEESEETLETVARTRDLATVAGELFPERGGRPVGAARERLWREFGRAIESIVKPSESDKKRPGVADAVSGITVTVVGANEFTLDQLSHTGELDLSYLSGARPAGT
ncbi:MAG TPA: hypothetical protein VHZ98_17385 [Galbitalea sp.]|jgi:hypothetical protein|nr:hypothetical protein [Galbitalea sp.]